MFWLSYENNNAGNMAWIVLKVSPTMADTILARFLEWVLKVSPPLPPLSPPTTLLFHPDACAAPRGRNPHLVLFGSVWISLDYSLCFVLPR